MQMKWSFRQQVHAIGARWRGGRLRGLALAGGLLMGGLLAGTLLAGGSAPFPPGPGQATIGVAVNSALSAAARPSVEPLATAGLAAIGLGRMARLIELVDEPSESCLQVGTHSQRTRHKAELSRMFAALAQSPVGAELLARAQAAGTFACLDRQTTLMGYYRSGLRLIGINDHLQPAEQLVFLAHELGHVLQHQTYSDNRLFPVQDLILLRRAREATAEALATLVIWQLRERGNPEAWRAKIADRFYGDIARAFADAWSQSEPDRRRDAATRAAFDRWFAQPARRALYDGMTVEHLSRISKDRLGLVSPRRQLHDGFLRGIARVGRWNFLRSSDGPALTDPHYAGGISLRHTAMLERLLESAEQRSAGRIVSHRTVNRIDVLQNPTRKDDAPDAALQEP